MPHAKVNGVELYYERHGDDGEPLVLVHGYTGDITDWRYQVEEFGRTHRVLVFDHRGHGRSEAPADRSLYSIQRMADDAEALAGHAGFDRYHLVGHSMGGAVAQEIALRSQRRLLSLTLHDTSPNFTLSRDERVVKFIAARNILAEQHGMEAVANMPALTQPPPFMSQERMEEQKARLARMSVDGYLGAWSALDQWPGVRDRLHEIAVPTLVIYGELDTYLVRAAKQLAEGIPTATLVEIPQAAHSPQEERPDLFNAALREHLLRASQSPPK